MRNTLFLVFLRGVFCFFLPVFTGSISVHAQLLKKWDKDLGGGDDDNLFSFQQTSDGGFILGGYSSSGIGGDKTQASRGDYDYWIVKTDSLGNKLWDKDFGGTDYDALLSIQQTNDGGYILAGTSYSGVGGDKTQPLQGVTDYWIIKTDSTGNKLWDKDFGGTSSEGLYSVAQTADGGYILGGHSNSGIGGDKTQASWGAADYWIVKTDSLGNFQWDKTFGSTDDDLLRTIQQTTDSGYILGGFSYSPIGGDKTQATKGLNDYWILKTDSLGNKEWDKDFGGSMGDVLFSMQQTSDDGFILGGLSNSGISGDKTHQTWGALDFWIVKTDSLGNFQWDKDFGGTQTEDEFGTVTQTSDGGYLLAGTSYSVVSGDKTQSNLGGEQTWVVKTDSLGNKEWDRTLLTMGHDETGLAIQTRDGCYVMGNFDQGIAAGDKSQPAWGIASDYWIIKFCDTTHAVATFISPHNICPGTCTDFLNTSTHATSYQWTFSGGSPSSSTDINPTNICYNLPGTYSVQLIASNNTTIDTLLLNNYITVYPYPPPQSITQSGDTLFAIAGAPAYQWYFNGNIINGATDYFNVAPISGDYNVVATDANGCEVEAAVFNVVASVHVIEDIDLLIFPNPVGDQLAVGSLQLAITSVSIYNSLGEMVLAVPLQTANCQLPTGSINVQSLSPGLYFLEITTQEKTFRSKFVRQ